MIAANILKNIRQTFENILPTQDGRTNIPPLDFVVAFIFSLLGDTRISSLESLRREVMKHLGISISRSSFWERLSRKRHLSFLEQIFSELVKQLTIPLLIGDGILKQLCVTDICLIDSTTIRLPEWAAKFFPGTGSSAAVKSCHYPHLYPGRLGTGQHTVFRARFMSFITERNDFRCAKR